jgi:hypothetical protein
VAAAGRVGALRERGARMGCESAAFFVSDTFLISSTYFKLIDQAKERYAQSPEACTQ